MIINKLMLPLGAVLLLIGCNSAADESLDRNVPLPDPDKTEAVNVLDLSDTEVSSEENNYLLTDSESISEVRDIVAREDYNTMDKDEVINEGLHLTYIYSVTFIEDFDNDETQLSYWVFEDGAIIIPTWEDDYFFSSADDDTIDRLKVIWEDNQ
ncbi:hypothetical protein MM300_13710 [Evansella sp. LMS18]|uniref:hypothetical protein n=1 Tax=Evansella sp. LMS18 TaxID=2924033 RepID=UPI0020D0248F|nr:hypothetical protein [Evansella sp. LMS18]UTR08986.1 hypothetical protein MM300_13710 [Evansella sp. LMS18]